MKQLLKRLLKGLEKWVEACPDEVKYNSKTNKF